MEKKSRADCGQTWSVVKVLTCGDDSCHCLGAKGGGGG